MVHALKEMHEYEHEESPNRPHLHHHCFDENFAFSACNSHKGWAFRNFKHVCPTEWLLHHASQAFSLSSESISSSGPLKDLMSQLCDTIFNF